MPLSKPDTSTVNGYRHMLILVNVDPDDPLNCAMTLVTFDSMLKHRSTWCDLTLKVTGHSY